MPVQGVAPMPINDDFCSQTENDNENMKVDQQKRGCHPKQIYQKRQTGIERV